MMMIDYNPNNNLAIPIINERRKSSPECLSHFKIPPSLPQKDLMKDIEPFHPLETKNRSLYRRSFVMSKTLSLQPERFSRPLSLYSERPTSQLTERPLSVYSERPLSVYSERPLSFCSSNVLPAAPVMSASLKKRRQPTRGTIKDELFQPPEPTARSDIELATEIGQGLLSEVRRMQTLLSERQQTLDQLTQDKQDTSLKLQLLLQTSTDQRQQLQQEIWDLELTKQGLTQQCHDLNSSLERSMADQVKSQTALEEHQRLLEERQQQIESLMDEKEEWVKAERVHHESLEQLRKEMKILEEEKEAIAIQLEQLMTSDDVLEERSEEKEEKPDEEREALQNALEQAHRLVETLQQDLAAEQQKKSEVDQLLRESQETIENLRADSMENKTVMIRQPTYVNNPFKDELPYVMHTMIGEWLFKYTRFRVGKGISNNSHRRFFWLHPYTKTLYWSPQEPGYRGELKAKSVSIESYYVINDSQNQPVIVIQSSTRQIKLQCTTKESHEAWIQSLSCLSNESEVKRKPSEDKHKRLSLLLENNPPNDVKKAWRMSLNSDKPSSVRFSSLRIK